MLNRNRLAGRATVVVVAVALGCLAGVLLPAGEARAEDTAAAREHYQKGTAFYDLGRYQDAIKEFEAAYEAKNDPALLYNLAQSHRLAGNTEQALHFYRTYLRRVPKAANRPEIEERIMALEKLADVKKGTQIPPNQTIPPGIPGTPPVVDTAPPPPVSVPPQTTTPLPPAPPVAPIGMQPPPPPTGMPAPPPATDPGASKRMLGLVAAGVGAVGIVAGILFGRGAHSAGQEVTDAGNAGKAFTQSLQDVESRGKRYQTLEFVSLGIGAVALAAGAFLYMTGSNSAESGRGGVASVPSLRLLPGAGSATLQVTF